MSCSDYHIFKKMNMTRRQAADYYLETIKEALNAGLVPRCHLEDVTRADFYGFVVPFVNEIMELSEEAGIPVKIRICDTMGYGVPYPEVAMPRSVAGLVYGLQHYSGVPSEMLEWHGHNDFYKAVANASAAWLYGASAVNCSLLGIGERTGNVPLEAMVFEYASLKGSLDGMDPTAVTEIGRYFKEEMGYEIPPMTPFVGENFNVTKAGIHADGLMKDEEIYNIFNTKKLLNRAPGVSVSKTSGLAGIAYWMNEHYELLGDERMTKDNPVVAALKDWVDEMYADGRTTSLSNQEMEDKISELTKGEFEKKMIDYKSLSLANQVYQQIEKNILSGVYKAGEIISESKLSEELGGQQDAHKRGHRPPRKRQAHRNNPFRHRGAWNNRRRRGRYVRS